MTATDRSSDPSLYLDIWEGAGEALLLLGPASEILAANPQASHLSQYSRSELVALGMGALVPEPDLLLARQMRLTLRRGESYVANVPWRLKDGSTLLVEMTGIPVDMYGQSMALILCRESAAAQKAEVALRERVSQLEGLYLASAMMVTDLGVPQLLDRLAEHVCQLTSATVSAIYLYEKERDVLVLESAHGMPKQGLGTALVRGEGLTWRCFGARKIINAARYADLPYAIDLNARLALGTDRYQTIPMLVVPLVWQDQALGVLALGEPENGQPFGPIDEHIGGLLANQVSMAIRHAKLFGELRASSEALERANIALRALDRMKDDFLSMVSHELQQPLATARLGVDLVLQQRETLGEQQIALLERALHSIDAQNHLINDLVYLVDLQGPTQIFQDLVNLGDVARSVAGAMIPAAQAKGLRVDLHLAAEPVVCQVAALALERVMEHLLDNAIKFTPQGHICITVRRDAMAGEAVLQVADSGIGISKEQQRRIFDRFYQVEGSSTRSYDGLGLGLALVRRFTDLYGGRVAVQSKQGQGSRFTVAFPLASV